MSLELTPGKNYVAQNHINSRKKEPTIMET